MSSGKILLADDEPDLLEVLGEYLEDEGYEVITAGDGLAALDILSKDGGFDLLLSDINMPRMKGFELIAETKKRHPAVKCGLITAYDINSYINLAKQYNVGNIFAKTSPFNFPEFGVHVRMLVTGEIFGAGRHLSPGTEAQKIVITHSAQIEPVIQKVSAAISTHPRLNRIRTALRELLVNAVYYGAKDEDGARKDDWNLDVALTPDEHVVVEFGVDGDKAAVAVIDQKGRLKKADVLFWLERNITRDPDTGLVKSIHDEHGRGLFISREFIDSLIINIHPGVRTEILLLNYFEEKFRGFKPLIINEL